MTTSDSNLRCVRCEYSLTGLSERGHCPECGLPVERSRLQHTYTGRNDNALAALTMGVLSLVLAPPLGVFAIHFFVKTRRDLREGNCSRSMYRTAKLGLVLGVLGMVITIWFAWRIATGL